MPGFSDHFSGRAAEYARFRPDYPAALFDYLAALCGRREKAWDCATGSGQAALGLARRFASVLATDAAIGQIASAARHRGVHYTAAAAERAPLPDASTDLVASAQALHWFDRARFWEETRRVLVRGGVIAVWCYHGFHLTPAVEAVVNRYYKEIVGPYWPAERALVERGYAELEFPFREEKPPVFALEKQWDLRAMIGYLKTWSATQRYEKAVGEDALSRIQEELEAAWGPPDRIRAFRWDLDLRVGRKG